MKKVNEEVIKSAVVTLAESLIVNDKRDVLVLIPKGYRFNTRNKLTNQIIKVLKIDKVYSKLRKSNLFLFFSLNDVGGVSMICGSYEGIKEKADITTIEIDSYIEMLKDTINGVEAKEQVKENNAKEVRIDKSYIFNDIMNRRGVGVLRVLIPKDTDISILDDVATDWVREAVKRSDLIMSINMLSISFQYYDGLSKIAKDVDMIYFDNYIKQLIGEPLKDNKQLFKDNIHKLDNIKDGIYINPVEFAKSTNIVVLMDLGLLEDKTSISNLFKDICSESGNPYIFGQTIIKEKITLIHYINGVSCTMNIRLKDLEKLDIRPINSLDELMELVNSL